MTIPTPPPAPPPPPLVSTEDPRLDALLRRDPTRCATIGEYAAASGLSVERVLDLLGPHLDDATLALEIVRDDVFLHTAPAGRPPRSGPGRVPANLWELLRAQLAPEAAYLAWRAVRQLQDSGWVVEVRPPQIIGALGPVNPRPLFALYVGPSLVPVVIYPGLSELAAPTGPLAPLEAARVPVAAVIVAEGMLDRSLTALRHHLLARSPSTTAAIVLEAPSFNPTLITDADSALRPRSVSRESLDLTGLL